MLKADLRKAYAIRYEKYQSNYHRLKMCYLKLFELSHLNSNLIMMEKTLNDVMSYL